ncbi:sugar MFS transporter [Cellvibrio sp. pealriver]|uniref:MFS transporter n=1 Tax=Cellvibrio sp. pealriver TaxID=1622269 RepID=UPI00066FF8A4|nr:MFS transporter [Cellvibrio sp. pealriver]
MAITNRHLMILVLMCNYFLFGLLLNSVGIVILQSINSFGVNKENAALLEGFKDLPIAIVSFFVASLLPRLGYRNAMLLAVSLVFLACLAMPLIASFWATKLFFLCVGAAFALIKVSVYASVGLLTNSKQHHASLLNSIEGVFMCGVLSGYWIFSAFIDDQNPASNAWLNVYWLLAGLCAFNLMLMSRVKAEDRAASEPATSSITEFTTDRLSPAAPATSPLDDFVAMLKLVLRPLVYSFMGAMFLYVLIEQGIGTWLPTFNNQVLKLPASIAVQITSLFALSLALGRLGAGWLLRFIPWHLFLAGCILAMASLILLTLPLAHNIETNADSHWFNLPLAAYLFPLIGLFMAPIYPLLNSLVLSALPQHQQSSMAGLIIIFSALGGTTGSIITGTVFNQLNGHTAFYLALVPMTCIFLLIFHLKRISN